MDAEHKKEFIEKRLTTEELIAELERRGYQTIHKSSISEIAEQERDREGR